MGLGMQPPPQARVHSNDRTNPNPDAKAKNVLGNSFPFRRTMAAAEGICQVS